MPTRREIFAGVMSGTSLDGVDAVLADFTPGAAKSALLAATHVTFPTALRGELLALQASAPDEIVRMGRAANALADLYVHALRSVCLASGIAAHDVVAAGVHGQTVRHRPQEGWTLQINNPARVAEHAYMTVVADFRTRDIAAGGQGAPLVPAFHAAMFSEPDRHRVIANIGGIANVTDLPTEDDVRGFDTGPGNVLLDLWSLRQRNAPYDDAGAWAASGTIDHALLAMISRGALLCRAAAQEHRARSLQRGLARSEPGAGELDRPRGRRAGDAVCADRAYARGRRSRALRGSAGIADLRRRCQERAAAATDRGRAATRARRVHRYARVSRANKSRRWHSRGSPAKPLPAGPAICPR